MTRTTNGSLLVLAALVLALPMNGQEISPLRKGRFFVSGSGSWKAKEYRVKSTLRWSIDPQVAYLLTDRFSLGLAGTIGLSDFAYSQTNTASGITRSNTSSSGWWGMGPSFRGYLGSDRFNLFAQLGTQFGRLQKTSENNFTENNESYFREKGTFTMFSFAPGISYYFSDHFGMEGMAHAYWVISNVRSGVITEDGQLDMLNNARYEATGGGWSIGLVYIFGLQRGALE